jgi:hypothetical protein
MTLVLSGSNAVVSTTTTILEFNSITNCQNASIVLKKENEDKIGRQLDRQVFVCAKK